MIEIRNLSKKIGRKMILKNINCTMENGVYGLLGPNGAGKTTLMRCMTNLYSSYKGEVLIDGLNTKKNKNVPIGYLPQSFALFKELNVYDSMNYFCNLKGIRKKERKDEIMRCLQAVHMEENLKKSSGKLSGGMMRRIGVAQALLNHPECIFFDEPTAGLDPEERMRFKNIISTLGRDETIIISTHIVEDIEACCSQVIIMDLGEVLCVKTCEELAQVAQGKVVCCKKGEEQAISCDYFVEKQFEKSGEIFLRILLRDSTCSQGFEVLDATIEDGYMAVIKGF